jgi:hypothetical protein
MNLLYEDETLNKKRTGDEFSLSNPPSGAVECVTLPYRESNSVLPASLYTMELSRLSLNS